MRRFRRDEQSRSPSPPAGRQKPGVSSMPGAACWAALACALVASGCVTPFTGDRAVIRAKNRVAPALVHVRPVKKVFTGGKREEVLVVGSGFIISRDGYVVTNEHVAGESKLVRCVLSTKEEVDAEVVGTDRYTDIAVLKLVSDHENYPTVRLGSSSRLKAGQTVLAMGSPHGLARSVSLGIISVTDRFLQSHGTMVSPYNNWIQTDAAINRGNSGGPLVNLKGEVIGVNARRLGGADNVGFAIPIDIAAEVIEAIIEQGRVPRSSIGVTLQEMIRKTDDPSQQGVVIADVDPLSSAWEAGIKPGDTLLAVNGILSNARFVEDLPPVQKLIADLPVDKPAEFRVARGGKELKIEVVTAAKSDLKGDEFEFSEWGFTASELTPAIVHRAKLPSRHGVLISGVQVGELAANAKLRRGDIILKVNGEQVQNLAAFRETYDACIASNQQLVMMDIKRGALTPFIVLKQTTEPDEPQGEAENVE